MIHGAKRKSKKYDADNSTHNRGKLTLVHCAASFFHPCLLKPLSSDEDTGAKLYIIIIVRINALTLVFFFPKSHQIEILTLKALKLLLDR